VRIIHYHGFGYIRGKGLQVIHVVDLVIHGVDIALCGMVLFLITLAVQQMFSKVVLVGTFEIKTSRERERTLH